jgi:phosphoketolase
MTADDATTDLAEQATRYRQDSPAFARWAAGYGPIEHTPETQVRIRAAIDGLARRGVKGDGVPVLDVLHAIDRVASAAMWIVVHETYARRVYLDGRALGADDFKPDPEGHTGGVLNMVPAYAGYMAINALTGITRAWLMGQGHCVAAIDTVNLLLGNMTGEHEARYDLSEAGLTRYVRDFYSYRLREDGTQDSPLGSHVNAHTAGGLIEGGYLGFAELQYVHMPLPGERLVAFLSDGAFEEQRGSDWAPRWWRAEDSGLVVPIMINNGRRIDQRTTMSQQGGAEWFVQHLRLNGFDPIVFDGRDPAAFAGAIFEMEERLESAARAVADGRARYPVPLPYGIAVAPKGAGFYGAGTNLAHNLPLGANPHTDAVAAARFNEHARRLWVAAPELREAIARLQHHARSGRPRERDHPLATRDVRLRTAIEPAYRPVAADRRARSSWTRSSPMAAVDGTFLATVQANRHLRARVGNPDEMRSNRMQRTLDALKFRVTDPEPGIPEAVDGAVITALNEEAVACAALANKGGINIIVTYEAFGTKMHGAVRQEIVFAHHAARAGRASGWLSVPLVLTSHTWENAKNEQSHQDPSMAEAMLGEPLDVSRVLFAADANTAAAAMQALYRTRGQIWTMVVPKAEVPDLFAPDEAERLVRDGGLRLEWSGWEAEHARLVLVAVGAYQLLETLSASARLAQREIPHAVVYLIEPGRFRSPRTVWEAPHAVPESALGGESGRGGLSARGGLFPSGTEACILLTHTRPEPLVGLLRPLVGGRRVSALGYINQGGTLNTPGLLFVNRCTWAHALAESARLLDLKPDRLLTAAEIDALAGRGAPSVIIDASPS